MFRFTVRELLLVTLAVAMGVGWWLRERQLSDEITRAMKSHGKAWALEKAAIDEGWRLEWFDKDQEWLSIETGKTTRLYQTSAAPPPE
jgi:hypothetical protein